MGAQSRVMSRRAVWESMTDEKGSGTRPLLPQEEGLLLNNRCHARERSRVALHLRLCLHLLAAALVPLAETAAARVH